MQKSAMQCDELQQKVQMRMQCKKVFALPSLALAVRFDVKLLTGEKLGPYTSTLLCLASKPHKG
jgi:hypothetical protein